MYREVKPLIENTFCEERVKDGKIVSYRIRPSDGYELHEITLDETVFDENGNETGETMLGYTESYVTASVDYDFKTNERQIYAVAK